MIRLVEKGDIVVLSKMDQSLILIPLIYDGKISFAVRRGDETFI